MEIPSFLRLAAETRDQIYDYLLSTEYTKYYPKEEDPVRRPANPQYVMAEAYKTC